MLNVVIACYDQPEMMAEQKRFWDAYPKKIQEDLRIIVVDDCGPNHPYTCEDETPYQLEIYRVKKNIPWNQMGARNLGMRIASPGWAIMLDPDMVISTRTMTRLQEIYPSVRRGHFWKLPLWHNAGQNKTDDWMSPNLYLCRTSDFWRAGGYNEDFAGAKGYSDVVLVRTMMAMNKSHLLRGYGVNYYHEKNIPDAQVNTLDRNLARNRKLFQRAVGKAKQIGWPAYAKLVKNPIRFEWEKVR